jgi:predicted O-methyltransferase YrrM
MVRIGSMFRRAAVVIRSVRTSGVGATWLALRAWRHSANQKLVEFAGLIKLLSNRELNIVLEIGTAHGGTYWTWCRLATPTAHLVSIDFPENDEWTSRVRGYPRPKQTQTLIRADSHDPRTVRSLDRLKGSVDLLFIDGDHSYEGVRADFENYAPLVRPGGLVAFHDVDSTKNPTSQVDRLWRQLRDLYDTREIIDEVSEKQSGRYGIGVLFWRGDEDLAKWSSTHRRDTEEPTASARSARSAETPPSRG